MSQHRAHFDQLDVATLYAILRLRVDIFVVDQRCAYPELDGRDAEAATVHSWMADDGDPAAVYAYLRILPEPDGSHRIGRVVTAPEHRGHGAAAMLVDDALAHISGVVVLSAQAHLEHWYARFGFVACGPVYVEDGIPHVPMRLSVASGSSC